MDVLVPDIDGTFIKRLLQRNISCAKRRRYPDRVNASMISWHVLMNCSMPESATV